MLVENPNIRAFIAVGLSAIAGSTSASNENNSLCLQETICFLGAADGRRSPSLMNERNSIGIIDEGVQL